jgi:hypothetical protein
MLARQSQLEGIVAIGEPITIAISSPFFSTMVEIRETTDVEEIVYRLA